MDNKHPKKISGGKTSSFSITNFDCLYRRSYNQNNADQDKQPPIVRSKIIAEEEGFNQYVGNKSCNSKKNPFDELIVIHIVCPSV